MKKLLPLLALAVMASAASAPVRAEARGELDPTFGEGGRIVREVSPQGLGGRPQAKQAPDGTVYFLGRGELFAFRPNGHADPGFGEGGMVALGALLPPVDELQFEIDPQGRVVIAGTDRATEGADRERLMLARLLPDGQLDPSFGNGGLVVTDLGFGEAELPEYMRSNPLWHETGIFVRNEEIAIDPLGRIVVTGSRITRFELIKLLKTGHYQGFTARFNQNGEVDPSYGEGGVAVGFTPEDVESSALAPDGSLYVVTRVKGRLYAIHLDSSGKLDPGFGSGGWRKLPPGWPVGLVGGDDGVVVWEAPLESREVVIRRLRRDGRLDRRFGRDGVFRAPRARYETVAVAPDHKGGLFAVSEWGHRKEETTGAKRGFLLIHLTPRGEMDRRFGRVRTGFGQDTRATLPSLFVDRRGRPLVAGLIESPLLTSRTGLALARYRVPR